MCWVCVCVHVCVCVSMCVSVCVCVCVGVCALGACASLRVQMMESEDTMTKRSRQIDAAIRSLTQAQSFLPIHLSLSLGRSVVILFVYRSTYLSS